MEGEPRPVSLPFPSSLDRTAWEGLRSGLHRQTLRTGRVRHTRQQRKAETWGHPNKGHSPCSGAVVSKHQASADAEDGLAAAQERTSLVHGCLFEWCQGLSCQARQAYLLSSRPFSTGAPAQMLLSRLYL